MNVRWEGDERGRGVADGRRLEPGIRELAEALTRPDWITENPEAHLLPGLEEACRGPGSLFQLAGAQTEEDGALVVDLHWLGQPHEVLPVRVAIFSLLGAVAESATYVRQRVEPGLLTFEVGTGFPEGDTDFAPHGHVLVLRVTDPFR